MNKKPVLFRFIFTLVVVIIFGMAINPPVPRNFFDTFNDMILKDKKDAKIEQVIAKAREKADKDKLYPSIALLDVAADESIDLTKYVKGKGLLTNKDVISLIRKQASGSIRLGIDLNGGAEFLLELVADKSKGKDLDISSAKFKEYRDNAIEILRNRLEGQNIFEAEILPAGDKFISMRVPIVAKDEKVKLLNIIQMSARLEFRLVHKNNAALISQYQADPKKFVTPVGYEVMPSIETDPDTNKQVKRYYVVKIKAEMTGKNVANARPDISTFGQRQIALMFNKTGAERFAEVTTENVGRQLAIVLDDTLYSAPNIREPITQGNAVITGNFSREEAQSISNALVSGSVPVKINVEAVFDTDPTLGKEAVQNGLYAGIMGLIIVMAFMAIYYLRAGLVADLALLINIVLVLGAIAAFEATLTLPGIAGIILTIGMAVDANVLIFERIREERNKGKTLLNAIDMGYGRAFTTILDANLTTLFTALILMLLGTGAIKGFAVTLSIGIITSMFTALFVSRMVFDVMSRSKSLSNEMKMLTLFTKTKINFLGMRTATGALSVILLVATLVTFAVQNKKMFGIDFTGGTQLMIGYQKQVPIKAVKDLLTENGYKSFKAGWKSSFAQQDNKVLEILLPESNISQDEAEGKKVTSPMTTIVEKLNAKFPDAKFTPGQETTMGGLIGEKFTEQAIWAIICALLGIVIYISIRFEFTYAIAAIIALIHDVIISTGIFIWFGNELSLPVIAALLTIIGYSLNDTIVVFDRVREDLDLIKDKTYSEIVNISINQTLSRTLLTSLTTLLVILVLFLFGGVAIKSFIFVLLIGVIVGTYSSIFVAAPIISVWNKQIGAKIGRKAKTEAEENTAPANA